MCHSAACGAADPGAQFAHDSSAQPVLHATVVLSCSYRHPMPNVGITEVLIILIVTGFPIALILGVLWLMGVRQPAPTVTPLTKQPYS